MVDCIDERPNEKVPGEVLSSDGDRSVVHVAPPSTDEDSRKDSPQKLRIRLPEGIEVVPDHSEAGSYEAFQFEAQGQHLPEKTPPMEETLQFNSWRRLLKSKFAWVSNNFDKPHFIPVIRGALASWFSLLLIVIKGSEDIIGQASFLMLMVAFLAPPIEATIGVIERELAILFTASIALAWTVLGIRLANLARKEFVPDATIHDIFTGRYIEAGPSVICAVFLMIGTGTLLYFRGRLGAGPFAVATIMGCMVVDVSFTVAPMFPYRYYRLGETVIIPLSFHSAVSILVAIFVYPETINSQYRKRFNGVFVQLSKALRTQPALFALPPSSDKFDPGPFMAYVGAAENGLAPLAASGRLLKKDISYGRLGPGDFRKLAELTRRLTLRANGMTLYFRIIDSVKEIIANTPARSQASTPFLTPSPSVPSLRGLSTGQTTPSNTSITSARKRRRRRPKGMLNSLSSLHLRHRHSFFHPHVRDPSKYPSSIFRETLERVQEFHVGVFESQRYLNLEARLTHPESQIYTARIMALLGESAMELLVCCADTVDHISSWFARINSDRFYEIFLVWRTESHNWEEGARNHEDAKRHLSRVLEEFRYVKRHRVLDLYRPFLDPTQMEKLMDQEAPPHRTLFQCFIYQYHLIYFAENLVLMLEEMIRLETERRHNRLWLPLLPVYKLFSWSRWDPQEHDVQGNQDEDPDIIPGLARESGDENALGDTRRRDADVLPPRNKMEAFFGIAYQSLSALGRGNAIFGMKAGVLTIILSLPNFLPSSASFAYHNRSLWGIVLGQITLARFRGDTTFGYTARIIATFIGGIWGIVMWCISTGSGRGNAYGLLAINGVCLPFLFFIRQYLPAPPLTVTIGCLTTQLIIGYSWQDTHLPSQSYAGYGVEVAFKRFVAVCCGVTIAYIFSYFPPTTTIRRYLRTSYSTTAGQLGQLYCDVVSYATVRKGPMTEVIVKDLIAIRMKLNRIAEIKQNAHYEVSLRGRWPAERYQRIHDIQMELAFLLSHLRSVSEHLEASWARAFLRRTRFLEPEFQGDVLAVISMISTALRSGTPLPQVTPCPLLDRFVVHQHLGLNVTMHKEGEEDADDGDGLGQDLPRVMTASVLEDEQYLYFSVGVATAFGVVTRLDRLMLAAKELVGEQYHIHGMALHHKAS